MLDQLLEVLRAELLTPKVHSLRVCIAYHDGQLRTDEVLLDSEKWPSGEALVADRQALLPDGMIAVRIFGLLVPDQPA